MLITPTFKIKIPFPPLIQALIQARMCSSCPVAGVMSQAPPRCALCRKPTQRAQIALNLWKRWKGLSAHLLMYTGFLRRQQDSHSGLTSEDLSLSLLAFCFNFCDHHQLLDYLVRGGIISCLWDRHCNWQSTNKCNESISKLSNILQFRGGGGKGKYHVFR